VQVLLLVLRNRWAVEAAERICSECRPLLCERVIGDAEAICIWVGDAVEAAEACAKRLCGRADCISVEAWSAGEELIAPSGCPLPYWLITETIGFQELSTYARHAPSPVDVYFTPTLLGQLVLVRGCSSSIRELNAYVARVTREPVIAWVLYPVAASICRQGGFNSRIGSGYKGV
jgi:hypothetical protein